MADSLRESIGLAERVRHIARSVIAMPIIWLLPLASADGAHNMAADEVLLESAGRGIASLRFYTWTPATVSLGYFQPQRVRQDDARLASLPFVRRPSGGMTLVHDQELTYALALPAGPPWQVAGQSPWLCRMHAITGAALALGACPPCEQPRRQPALLPAHDAGRFAAGRGEGRG